MEEIGLSENTLITVINDTQIDYTLMGTNITIGSMAAKDIVFDEEIGYIPLEDIEEVMLWYVLRYQRRLVRLSECK